MSLNLCSATAASALESYATLWSVSNFGSFKERVVVTIKEKRSELQAVGLRGM